MPVLALTSVPSRFAALGPRLEALLGQRPQALCLTIPRSFERFPDWDGRLPALPAGVTLYRADDAGPATKFLTAFQMYPDRDVLLLDDDCTYGPGLLPAFRAARALHPEAAISASVFDSARLGLPSGYSIVQGFAGLMLRPDRLSPSVLTPDAPAQWVDDIWLSAHLALAGIEIVHYAEMRAHTQAHAAPDALQDARLHGMTRAELNRTVAADLRARFGIWQGDNACMQR
ncbi:hypothetical protein P1J78_12395 [Psychromarinibacter sp. C21-152]|uniref:Glycosyl transferase family 2 n=1 Tax=Psychromarinibacter sediminicola TaxID=3033385 RepID=A0AAE3NSB9_9RHOB|nr:hypothetical protein [Psychromarinibacter sediminicola]MDF0601536.1 hypothetical protein [Psychromarinibacter sediminicola]